MEAGGEEGSDDGVYRVTLPDGMEEEVPPMHLTPSTLNHKPYTVHPTPYTLNPKP